MCMGEVIKNTCGVSERHEAGFYGETHRIWAMLSTYAAFNPGGAGKPEKGGQRKNRESGELLRAFVVFLVDD